MINLRCFRCLIPPLLAVTAAAWLQARGKKDVLYLKNGDRLTCEIKSMTRGQLMVETDYTSGTIVIDWKEVDRIDSPQRFQLQVQNGALITGSLKKERAGDPITVTEEASSAAVAQPEVVWVRQLERGALARFGLSIDYGFSFAKANSDLQSNLSLNSSYTTERRLISNNTNLVFNAQDLAADTQRVSINNLYAHAVHAGRWYYVGLADFLSNSEQNLDLRTTLGGGLARYLIRSNQTQLTLLGGVVYSRDRFSNESARAGGDNLEALARLEYATFRFDFLDYKAQAAIYPALSDPGRVRIDFNTALSMKLMGDNLFWKISAYTDFDSRPPGGTSKTDSGITASIGWSIF